MIKKAQSPHPIDMKTLMDWFKTKDPQFQEYLNVQKELGNVTRPVPQPKVDFQQQLFDWRTNDPAKYNGMLDMEKEIAKVKAPPKVPALRNALMVGLGVVGVSIAADAIIKFFKSQYKEYKSQDYYQKMLEAHPQLLQEDPKEVARYWESLYHFAPHMAEDPLAAGAYITQSLRRLSGEQLGGPPPDTFATLADIQKKGKEGKSASDDLGIKARQEAVSQIVRGMYS